jgi:hypothetical protein
MKQLISDELSTQKKAKDPITQFSSVWDENANIMYKGPVSYLGDDNDKLNYYAQKIKKAANDNGFGKITNWKSREVEKWTTKLMQVSISLDNVVQNRQRTRLTSKRSCEHISIRSLDVKGSYYDGMNLIYILFYSIELHALFVSAYDISDKSFYQISLLGELQELNKANEYPDETVVAASAYLRKNGNLYWYVKGSEANVWIAEHKLESFRGSIKHYVCFKKTIGQYISDATLLAINGSCYLAGVEHYGNKTTVFATDRFLHNYYPCLHTSRKKPIVIFVNEQIYHIGGLVNQTDPLVEVHQIYLRNTDNTVHDYHPMQRRQYRRNTAEMSELFTLNSENSCYCHMNGQVYIFNEAMRKNEEYFVYSILENSWQVFMFPEGVNPPFPVDSSVAVGVGRQIYLFLIGSDEGEINFKVLNMSL